MLCKEWKNIPAMFLASKHSASHGTGSLYFFNHKADSAEQMRWQSCKFPKMMICQKLLKMTNQGIQFVHKQQILVLKTFPPICFFCFRWKRRKDEDCQNWYQSNFILNSLVTEKLNQQRHRNWRRKSKAMFPPDNLVLSQHQLRNIYVKNEIQGN